MFKYNFHNTKISNQDFELKKINPQKIINSKARVDINKILNRVKSEKKFNKHKNFIIYIIVTFTVAALALFLSN
jgi:hypothetical protein